MPNLAKGSAAAGFAQGIELGYAEIAAAVTQTGAGNQDVSGLAITVTVGQRPIVVEFGCELLKNSSASGVATGNIQEGATVLADVVISFTTVGAPITRRVRLAPSAGTHTYKVNIVQSVTGNTVLNATATSPAYLTAYQV